jgi:transposase
MEVEPVSNEIREKIIIHKENGRKEAEIAKWLIISKSTVTKVWARYRKTGSYLPNPKTQGRKTAVDVTKMAKIKEEIRKTPDATLAELIEKFDLKITESALSRKLKKLGYSFKKRQLIQQNKTARMSRKNGENLRKR